MTGRSISEKLLGQDYEVITADDRLDKIAADFVEHCATRWESGKSMLVCIDKITCGRMWQRIIARWQAKLEQKQGFLGRIVDIGAELFAMSATCVRAEGQRVADPVLGQQAYELAETFCQQATLRIEALFDALWTNTDSSDVQLTHDVLQGRYSWLEDGIVDQSEGTGPWIANWEAGASTEINLARRFLTLSQS